MRAMHVVWLAFGEVVAGANVATRRYGDVHVAHDAIAVDPGALD